jgi:hypothetical protein
MGVVDRTIDELLEMESKLGDSENFDDAFPLYLAKRKLEESLESMEADINRYAKGWTWMPPPQVHSQGAPEQCVPTALREKLPRSPVTTRGGCLPTG